MTSPTCNQCANLLGNRSYQDNWEKWRCGASENLVQESINLISGLPIRIYTNELCKDQRNDMPGNCGVEGKWFKLYTPPQHQIIEEAEKFSPVDLDSLADAAAKRVTELKRGKKGKLTNDDLNNL